MKHEYFKLAFSAFCPCYLSTLYLLLQYHLKVFSFICKSVAILLRGERSSMLSSDRKFQINKRKDHLLRLGQTNFCRSQTASEVIQATCVAYSKDITRLGIYLRVGLRARFKIRLRDRLNIRYSV